MSLSAAFAAALLAVAPPAAADAQVCRLPGAAAIAYARSAGAQYQFEPVSGQGVCDMRGNTLVAVSADVEPLVCEARLFGGVRLASGMRMRGVDFSGSPRAVSSAGWRQLDGRRADFTVTLTLQPRSQASLGIVAVVYEAQRCSRRNIFEPAQ